MRIFEIIVMLAVGASICTATEIATPPAAITRAALADDAPLEAAAGCIDGRVVVQNKSGEIWTDIKIQVNGEYEHAADGIPPYTTMRYLPSVFTRSDGTRLDLSRVACKRIDIHASTPSGRRHWNGGR